MANRTDPFAASVHGTNPQHLIEKITRSKIYSSMYWKEHCFALNAETVIDKCISLKAVGGVCTVLVTVMESVLCLQHRIPPQICANGQSPDQSDFKIGACDI